jgi:hypothetical protein
VEIRENVFVSANRRRSAQHDILQPRRGNLWRRDWVRQHCLCSAELGPYREDGPIQPRTLGLTISRSISGGLHEDYELEDGEQHFHAPHHCVGTGHNPRHSGAMSRWLKSVAKIETSNEEFYRLFRQALEDMAALSSLHS